MYRRRHTDHVDYNGLAKLYERGKRLYVRLPDSLSGSRNKFFSLGLPANHYGYTHAVSLLGRINQDIVTGNFDWSLVQYRALRVNPSQRSIYELWLEHCESKKNVKASTQHYLVTTIGDKLKLLKCRDLNNAQAVADELLEVTTSDFAHRVMGKLASLYEWCLEEGKVSRPDNPYKRLIKKLGVSKEDKEATPRALTSEEINSLLAKLVPHYAALTRFLLYTGCRPSEGVGFKWDAIKDDHIVLGRSYVKKEGKVFESNTSKTGKKDRYFPLEYPLRLLLNSMERVSDWVFPDAKGEPISYDQFSRVWKRVAPPGTTPYNCRDTFISLQCEAGIPPIIVANWVNNSVAIIEKHYLSTKQNVKPIY